MSKRVTAREFGCGAIERIGGVAIEREHGVYHIKRHPSHRLGWAWECAYTVNQARQKARDLAKGGGA